MQSLPHSRLQLDQRVILTLPSEKKPTVVFVVVVVVVVVVGFVCLFVFVVVVTIVLYFTKMHQSRNLSHTSTFECP